MTAAGSNAAPPVKLKMNMLDLILSRPPGTWYHLHRGCLIASVAPFRDEKEEEGLTAFDLIYRYQANVRKWYLAFLRWRNLLMCFQGSSYNRPEPADTR